MAEVPVKPYTDVQVQSIRRRSISVLALGQILGGLGGGATLTLGSLLIVHLSGLDSLAGMAATMNTLGAAAMAIPLAMLAHKYGRRISLSTGALIAAFGSALIVTAAILGSVPLLFIGMLVLGTASAMNLQSRFAATDLSSEATRGRDLSLVVWTTTIGAVIGPNLFAPGEVVSQAFGLPEYTGGFLIAMAAQVIGMIIYFSGLRPDPMKVALVQSKEPAHKPRRGGGFRLLREIPAARRAVITVALSHAYMVSLMSMTPVHMQHHGATLTIIGLTISLHVLGMYALSPVFGWLTDKVGGRTVVLAGQILFISASLCVWFAPTNATVVTVALGLLGLGWSASTVAGSTMVSGAVPVQDRTSLQGTSDLLMNLAGAAGGLSAGPILAVFGFHGLALGLLVLAAIVVLVNRRTSTPVPAMLTLD
ncbi:MFS transporter [Glutamicibacter sp.]|uniref:MFS transporter n=1 Tax=Glutamicibacter sp. TaxID=1931995 RepID=UPI0028BE4504|nr:MFS transporter [Glutamicibacter sp.]